MSLASNEKKNPNCAESHVGDMGLKGRPVLKLFSNKSNQVQLINT